MKTTIPADLLELKSRFDTWRTNRKYKREPIPDELRQVAVDLGRRYPPSIVRRTLKIDLQRVEQSITKHSIGKKHQTAFFNLPLISPDPESSSHHKDGCRLQLERADDSRLTLTLPALDFLSTRQICADFLRD
ncbi:MAG: hypothetical protein IPM55_19765 [Acidobacteria bacterium]|nr:hypothetical protein [Acidobacteriota bacterium]